MKISIIKKRTKIHIECIFCKHIHVNIQKTHDVQNIFALIINIYKILTNSINFNVFKIFKNNYECIFNRHCVNVYKIT